MIKTSTAVTGEQIHELKNRNSFELENQVPEVDYAEIRLSTLLMGSLNNETMETAFRMMVEMRIENRESGFI